MFARLTLLLAALAASTPALAGALLKRNHVLTFTNNCAQQITPMIHAADGSFVTLARLNKGGVTTTTVAEGVSFCVVFEADKLLTLLVVAFGSCLRADRLV